MNALHDDQPSPARQGGAKRRVLIDGYFLGRPSGFGRFITEMCRALGLTQNDLAFVVAVPETVDQALLVSYPNLIWHKAPKRNFLLWEQFVIPRLARRLGCDIVHFPYNTSSGFTRGLHSVTTVHDTMFLGGGHPVWPVKTFAYEAYIRHAFLTYTRRSGAIISVSEATRTGLAALGIESSTIYNTVDGFLATYPHPGAVPGATRYLLHRGGLYGHKNTDRVIQAFRLARPLLQGAVLRVLGAPGGADHWNSHAEPDIQFLSRVSDKEMATLYAESSCVIAASLQEGFGLPIIEAFGFKAPVITSNIDPMKEIAGDAAVLVDPASTEALSAAMIAVLTDQALADALVEKGLIRLQAFSSDTIARQLVATYERVGRA